MIKKIFLTLCLTLPLQAYAQFAPGYGPSSVMRQPQAPEAEEDSSSILFRGEPRPVAPKINKKATPYSGAIRILASVNGDIITTEDINNRVRAFSMTTGIPYNGQTKLLILNKVMQNTIDEKLKAQEAEKDGVSISDRELDSSIAMFCQNNGITEQQLNQSLNEYGISRDVFREQMKNDLAWIRVVQHHSMRESITEPEIKEALNLAEKDMSKPKFMLSEIVISAEDAKHLPQLMEKLRQDPRFELFAAQFSSSATSSSGGHLGWVNQGQLPQKIEKAIKNLETNEISEPIFHNHQYYIYKLEKKFDPQTDKMPTPSHDQVKNMLKNQKSERFAAQHLQTLRQRAVIELKE